MLSQKENMLRTILRTGDPEWVPLLDDCMEVVISSEDKEYPPFGQGGKDWFGVPWAWDDASHSHGPDARFPLALEDICEWRDVVKFPDLDAIDWEAAAKRDLAGRDTENKLIRMFCSIGPFERMNFLMGMENAMINMYEEPEEYQALIEKVTDHKIKLIGKYIEYYHPDEIFFHDDLGGQNAPMISLDMYREFIKPCHKRIGEFIRSKGVIFTQHSCGYVQPFIDEFIDNGAQCLNPLQPTNDWEMIAEKYADKISFNIGAESVANYADATEEEVRAFARRIIDVFGPHKNLSVVYFVANEACAKNAPYVLDEIRTYGKKIYEK